VTKLASEVFGRLRQSHSGRGLPQSKTLARWCEAFGLRQPSAAFAWSALWKAILLMLNAELLFLGCSSAKPPKPAPAAVAAADRSATQAAKLSASQNWTAAIIQWQSAVDRYRLLNDRTNEAIGLHNLAEARQHAGDWAQAHELFEAASALNSALKIDEQWWRNQIALLQVEAKSSRTNELARRIEELTPRFKQLANRSLRALFLNELGLWHTERADFDAATKDFGDALQLFAVEKNDPGVATVLANQGLLMERQKNFSAAAQKWNEAQKLFERLAEPKGIAVSMAGHGRALLKAEQDLAQAKDLLRRAERNFRMLRDETRARQTAELLTNHRAERSESK
jgi:tetratricopeptide (TPR) repeat protein